MIVKRIDTALTLIEKMLIQVLFSLMIIVTLIQVFNRNIFNYPLPWADEAARYLFVWVVFIGSSYAVREKAHIGVTAFIDKLPVKFKRMVELFNDIVCFVFSISLSVFVINIMKVQIKLGQVSPSLRLPMEYAYLGLAIGSFFMGVRFMLHIYGFRNKERKIYKD